MYLLPLLAYNACLGAFFFARLASLDQLTFRSLLDQLTFRSLGSADAFVGTVPSVSDPDPDWIRIQSDHWIRIRNLNTDPDPGGQK